MDEQTTPSGEAPAFPLAKLAKAYRRIRARMAEVQGEYDTKMEKLKEDQTTIKHAIKDILLAQGATSSKTPEGTIVLTTKTRFNTQDWDSLKQFVVAHDAVDLLERRIHQSNMAAWIEENPGVIPPGLNTFTEYDVSVRKPNS